MQVRFKFSTPKDYDAVFPNRCVVCNAEDCSRIVRVEPQVSSWLTWALPTALLRTGVAPARVAMCRECDRTFWLRRHVVGLVAWGLVPLGVAAILLFRNQVPNLALWVWATFAIVIITSHVVLGLCLPERFRYELENGRKNCVFTYPHVMAEFGNLNESYVTFEGVESA